MCRTIMKKLSRGADEDMKGFVRVAETLLEILILTRSVKLIQDYTMPLTLGNECSGIVAEVGSKVTGFQKGDRV